MENITFEGVIANHISFQHSTKLTLDSLKSILTALKDFTGTENEYAQTITLSGESWAILDADGNNSPNGNTWRDYVAQKKWNI